MTILKIAALSGLILAAALAGCSSSNYGPASTDQSSTVYRPHNEDFTPNYRASTSIGSVMTTREGATVYTFDNDQLGKSTCYADCARTWPPVIALDGAQP
jgi:predicted lipoprotein with Yx(FWY)xxD motif